MYAYFPTHSSHAHSPSHSHMSRFSHSPSIPCHASHTLPPIPMSHFSHSPSIPCHTSYTLPPIPIAHLNSHTLRPTPMSHFSHISPCHTPHILPPVPRYTPHAYSLAHPLGTLHTPCISMAHSPHSISLQSLYGTHLTLSLPTLISTLSLDHLAEGW